MKIQLSGYAAEVLQTKEFDYNGEKTRDKIIENLKTSDSFLVIHINSLKLNVKLTGHQVILL